MDIDCLKKQFKEKVNKISLFLIENYSNRYNLVVQAEIDILWTDWLNWYKTIPKELQNVVQQSVDEEIYLRMTPEIKKWALELTLRNYNDRLNDVN